MPVRPLKTVLREHLVQGNLEEIADLAMERRKVLGTLLGLTFDADVEVVRRVREAVGPDVALRIDANQGYDLATTARFLAASRARLKRYCVILAVCAGRSISIRPTDACASRLRRKSRTSRSLSR